MCYLSKWYTTQQRHLLKLPWKPHECFGRLEKDKMPWNFAVISGVSEVRLMGKEHQRMKMLYCSLELQPTPGHSRQTRNAAMHYKHEYGKNKEKTLLLSANHLTDPRKSAPIHAMLLSLTRHHFSSTGCKHPVRDHLLGMNKSSLERRTILPFYCL